MLRVRHLLLVVGLIGLMAVPGLVRAVSQEETCTGSWTGRTERSCTFISGSRITLFAAASEGAGTVRVIEVQDGVERTIAYCSFSSESAGTTPAVQPSPISVYGLLIVSPAPVQVGPIDETVAPPGVSGSKIPGLPGGCDARMVTIPHREMICRVSGSGRGIFGCSGLSN